ncbi:PEP-CTERM sorting domain-containing protein [Nostoc sp. WHI]|uniref:PEP-CTERM sorting domain-containing protein n=1 Tax=Nostoc sp. WHI TaxID=2650611 RepID=UPI0018C5AF7C|nr:PEP-CTERM sorting domain-containing protein [Nostoc sp. WHI]MBG1268697.1 PEP-CTERM sorting domain-containing protein [Nostoc sp. WHI]
MSNFTFIKRSTLTASFITLASFTITATPSQAVSIDFSSWETFGDVTTPGLGQTNLSNDGLVADDFPATSGTFSFSGIPAGDAFGSLQSFLGVNSDALDINGFAWEGSAIKSTYLAQAGEKFNFNWNFLTNESTYNDFAFLVVDGTVTKLADITNATNGSSFFNRETGVNSFTYTFNSSKNYTVALGVVDLDDPGTTSAFKVSNANIQEVPEPATMMGLLVALGFSTRMVKRLRNQA